MNKENHNAMRERREIQAKKTLQVRENKIKKYTARQVKAEENKALIPTIIFVIVAIIVIINYIRALNDNNTVIGFKNFIEALQTLSNTYIQLPTLQNLTITADWGAFEFIKNAINTVINILNVLLFICNNLVNLIIGIMNTLRIMIFS